MALSLDKDKAYAGKFLIEEDCWVPGSLLLAGRDTCLHLYEDAWRSPFEGPIHIQGELYDGQQVMLVECLHLSIARKVLRPNTGKSSHHRFFPHYVLVGQLPCWAPTKPFISQVRFSIDDSPALFSDGEAFGFAGQLSPAEGEDWGPDVNPLIEEILRHRHIQRDTRWHREPIIAFFTGKTELFSVDTVWGRISATHDLSQTHIREMFDPYDPHIHHEVVIVLDFGCGLLDFQEAVRRTTLVQQFLEVAIGRLQTKASWQLILPGQRTVVVHETLLDAEWRRQDSGGTPHFQAVLIHAARHPDHFSEVLSDWLRRNTEWGTARHLVYRYYGKRGLSDNRDLITAATAFEYLPYPEDIAASSAEEKAEEKAMIACLRTAVKAQAASQTVKNRARDCIGHIKNRNLRQKIHYWVRTLSPSLCAKLPHFQEVAGEAVRWRNRLVHGSQEKNDTTDYANLDMLVFLTQTLQFLFVVSDLLASGWNVGRWLADRGGTPHPLARFLLTYQDRLAKLEYFSPTFKRKIEDNG